MIRPRRGRPSTIITLGDSHKRGGGGKRVTYNKRGKGQRTKRGEKGERNRLWVNTQQEMEKNDCVPIGEGPHPVTDKQTQLTHKKFF